MQVYKENTKEIIGLGNVDNTADVDKPVSTAVNTLFASVSSASNLFQGLSWDSSTDVCTRLGSISSLAKSVTAGFSNLPIHDAVRRCVRDSSGNTVYLLDKDSPYMQDGMDLIDSGSAENNAGDTFQVLDSTKTFLSSNVSVGDFVFVPANIGTVNDYIAKITAIPDDTHLTIDKDIVDYGTSYKIGNFDYLGGDGNVFARIPKFYAYKDLVGTVHTWLISLYRLPGYIVHPAFIVNGVEVDYRYYSAFEGSMYDDSASAMTASSLIATSLYATGDKMCSVAQEWAKTSETLQEYRLMAKAVGIGFENVEINLNAAVQLLYLVDFADFNAQTSIGLGRTNLSGGTYSADSYIGKTGLSILDGTNFNSVSNGGTSGYLTDYMTYLGIENFFGNVWKMIDNVGWDGRWTGVAAAQPVYITNDFSKLIDSSSKNLKKLVDAPYIGTSDGYIADIEDNLFFIPKTVGASSTTKLTDYYYQYSEVGKDFWRVFLFGGVSNNGEQSGFWTVSCSSVFSFVSSSIGGRLCF